MHRSGTVEFALTVLMMIAFMAAALRIFDSDTSEDRDFDRASLIFLPRIECELNDDRGLQESMERERACGTILAEVPDAPVARETINLARHE
jgi:hypothetical protein